MPTANTGPKAVLADAAYAQFLAAERDRHSAATMNEMAATFGRGMTVSEEEDLRQKEQETGVEMVEWRTRRMEELRSKTLDNSSDNNSDDPEGWESKVRRRRRGAVRQIDAQGLLAAIERPGWALLLLPSMSTLSTLNEHDTDDSEEPADEEEETRRADTDVLPTLLAYRDGELVHTWIRVDWCAPEGVEAMLRSSGVLRNSDGERDS
ncbi:hypothetical protein QFC20_002599 [Naganishia adeliensis]|uniref:Uncharacterized protein n=1 Tax=Naganishia adeliensis TaxID=92952 RepID=A0ACC2WHS7_9TREE|nr:hypothetical protein QFC20_002599 [Naganishia adeliensis]